MLPSWARASHVVAGVSLEQLSVRDGEQSKVLKNKRSQPSKRVLIRKRKKRAKVGGQLKAIAETCKSPDDNCKAPNAYTEQVQASIEVLGDTLIELKVIARPISSHGKLAKALAACLFHDQEEATSLSQAAKLYGADQRDCRQVSRRLSNVGGVYKVVATQAALKAGQHSKDAKSRNLADTLSSIIRSGRKTRAAAKIWAAEPENSASSLAPTMPFSQPLLPQPLTVLFDEPEPLALPAPTLAADWLPGGSRHCGGDLLFALLTLVHPDGQRRMPLFAKKSGSITAFPGSDLTHGTTRHDPRGQRLPGCEAHVSFAVQTPAATLGVSRTSKAGKAMHEQLLSAGEQDILEGPLRRGGERGAVWLAVQNAEAWAQKPKCQLEYNAATMWALPYEAVVLYDVVSGRPLVAYDAFGGLVGDEAVRAAATFRFLDSFKFTLNRQRESYAQGALGLDGAGEQRMLMLGIRHQSFNMGNRPDKGKQGRVWLSVKNYIGDLDAYVAHWDHRHACSSAHLQPVWNAMAARMRAHLPQFCSKLEAALRAADVEKRLYCEQSGGMISDDLIVNNVGASSYYQSPSHVDQNDRGWTFAVAVKCVSPQSGMRCNCGQQTANQQT